MDDLRILIECPLITVIPVGDHNTGVLFGIQRAPEPQQLYELLEQTRGWTHVEYSNGYLICAHVLYKAFCAF